MAESEEEQDQGLEFSGRMESAKELHSLLSCLANFKGSKHDQNAHIEISPNEIVFIVKARSKHTACTGTLPNNIFSSYECNEAGGSFCINLGTMMECLGIFGSSATASTTVSMEYHSNNGKFEMLLEDQGILTVCSLSTIDTDEYTSESWSQMTSAFRTSNQLCKVMLKPEFLREALYELQDLQGASVAKVLISSSAPYFQLSAEGNLGSLEIEFSKSSDLFQDYECEGTNEWEYPLNALLQGMRALAVANETYIRVNDEGVMCIQHQIDSPSGKKCFVDFLLLSNNNDEDEEDDEDGGMNRPEHD